MAQWRLRSEHYLPQEIVTSLEGRLCLGFVNTLHPRYGRHVHDALTDFHDLVAWNRSVGMLTEEEERDLLLWADARPQEALRPFERAIAMREAIYRILSAVAAKSAPQSADLSALRDAFAEAMAHASLSPTASEFSWEWETEKESRHGGELKSLLWPVALSAIELLSSAKEWGRIKECPGCGWLFLDTSKTGNRRWCSMDACGSRAKMRRQYTRKRAEVRQAS
jgi:predicted RNA-binding Zn ribbon-like protein